MKDRLTAKRKIAFVSSTAWTMYNFRKEVLEDCLRSGYEVYVIAAEDAYSALLVSMGCRFIPVTIRNRSFSPVHDIRLYIRLKRIYKNCRPDFIFHYVVKPNIYGTLAARLLKIPSVAVVTGLGHAFNKQNLLKWLITNFYRFSLRSACEVWCLNKEDAEYFVHHRIVPVQKLKVLPGEGINTEHFKRSGNHKNASEPFAFLMSARLLKSKGILEYADATLILQKKKYTFRCFLLGAQEDHPDALSSKQIREWQEERGLQYIGFANDVRAHLSDCDCFVYPSYYNEGIPRSLLEACSMELPVITTDNTGCRDLIEDGINGFICHKRDRFELAAKMEKMLLLNASQRLLMGKKGREMISARYSVDLVIKQYRLLLESYFEGKHEIIRVPVREK